MQKFSLLLSIYAKEKSAYLDACLYGTLENQIAKPDEVIIVKDGPLTNDLNFVLNHWFERYPNLIKFVEINKRACYISHIWVTGKFCT